MIVNKVHFTKYVMFKNRHGKILRLKKRKSCNPKQKYRFKNYLKRDQSKLISLI